MIVTVTEPMTMGTDYLLAAVCFAFAARLREASGAEPTALAFVVTGIAAVLGGTVHGFRIPLGSYVSAVWGATLVFIAAGSSLLIAAGIQTARLSRSPDRALGLVWMKRAVAVTIVALCVWLAGVSLHRHFNENDLYHVIQLAGLYCLYRGSLLLTAADKPPESAR